MSRRRADVLGTARAADAHPPPRTLIAESWLDRDQVCVGLMMGEGGCGV
jgi:hypothetical protein